VRRAKAPRRRTIVLLIVLASGPLTGVAFAQRGFGGGFRGFREGGFPYIAAPEQMPDASFVVCRLEYRSVRSEPMGIGWQTDYPYAEVNLTTRLSELTKTRVSRDNEHEINYWVIRLTDPALFDCPFLMGSDVGTASFSDDGAKNLREYLLKGGFLWADDFWGSHAWDHWVTELGKVLPPGEYPIKDLPRDHPLFRSQFEVLKVPQIPSINFWMGSGGGTSERYQDSAVPHARGIEDSHGRLMVLMTHNTDLGDSFEREADDPRYFYTFSVDGYAFGIDTLLYAMTH